MTDSIRWGKKCLMTKRLLLKKAVEFADTYYQVLDEVGKICADGEMGEEYGRDFFLAQLIENYNSDEGTIENEKEESSDEA